MTNVINFSDYIKSKDFMQKHADKKAEKAFFKQELDAQMLADWLVPYDEEEKAFWK